MYTIGRHSEIQFEEQLLVYKTMDVNKNNPDSPEQVPSSVTTTGSKEMTPTCEFVDRSSYFSFSPFSLSRPSDNRYTRVLSNTIPKYLDMSYHFLIIVLKS